MSKCRPKGIRKITRSTFESSLLLLRERQYFTCKGMPERRSAERQIQHLNCNKRRAPPNTQTGVRPPAGAPVEDELDNEKQESDQCWRERCGGGRWPMRPA